MSRCPRKKKKELKKKGLWDAYNKELTLQVLTRLYDAT